MKKVFPRLLVLTAFLAVALFSLASASLAEESIQATIEVRPNTLTGTGTVDVSINVINICDDPKPLSVILYDPANNVCSTFGSGGTAHLSPGESAVYKGRWSVTADQLEKGRITYVARYTTVSATGQPVAVSKPFAATIKHNAARASLDIDRSTPQGGVTENQTVNIKYTITNTGTIDILDITIKDPGINNEVLVHPLLAVGQTVVLSTSYVAGITPKTTNATISYKYVVGDKTETKEIKSNPKEINVAVPDLAVELKASSYIVNPGQKVDLTCTITNRSELSYEQLKVTDKTLKDVEPSFSLGPKKTHVVPKSITVLQSSTYQFVVTGFDTAGQPVEVMSNEITIQTTGDATGVDSLSADVIPVVLDVYIEADRDIIYSEPSEIIFRVKVTNNGMLAAENVYITAGRDKKTVHKIDRIEPGQTVEFLKRLSASMGGQYQFDASAKNNRGETETASSNIHYVSFQPTKPPVTPPPAPLPTVPPQEYEPTQAPVTQPEETEASTGRLLLYILAGLLVVIVLAVVLLFVLDHRRGKQPKPPSGRNRGHGGQNVVIDSIQRSPHRDYARAPKRGSAKKKVKKEQPAVPAYAPDDEEAFFQDEEDEAPVSHRAISADNAAAGRAADGDAAYRRPPALRKGEPQAGEDRGRDDGFVEKFVTPVSGKSPGKGTPESMEETEVYRRDYLARIRQGGAEAKEDEDGEDSASLSAEDAALLSGSTGQYRLSRRAGSVNSVRRGEESPESEEIIAAIRKAEEPEEFARKQRAARGAQSIANFYDDDDEDGGDDAAKGSRKRRK